MTVDDRGDNTIRPSLSDVRNAAGQSPFHFRRTQQSKQRIELTTRFYGKFKYEQKRKAANSAKQHQVQLKEIRLRPKTGEHDIDFKVKQAREFLVHKDKVKFNVQFKGRENAHHDRGREMLASIIEQLQDVSKVEKTPSMEGGRNMTAVLSPKA